MAKNLNKFVKKTKMKYEITIEYNNGVRVGNIPESKQRTARSGNNHTWFPKSWTSQDIEDAANYVASTYKKMPLPRAHIQAFIKALR